MKIKMDLYQCEECGGAFAVEKDQDPHNCAACGSDFYEFICEIETKVGE